MFFTILKYTTQALPRANVKFNLKAKAILDLACTSTNIRRQECKVSCYLELGDNTKKENKNNKMNALIGLGSKSMPCTKLGGGKQMPEFTGACLSSTKVQGFPEEEKGFRTL